jgi:nicotinamide-nucleotide amidase
MAAEGLSVIVTSGGLGPTADDLTAEVVAEFCGRPMVLDEELEARITEIVTPLMARWPGVDPEAVLAANRKQAVVPEGATVLDPVGTAPGLVVPSAGPRPGPTVVVLPGPPRELMPMWRTAVETEAFKQAVAGAEVTRREMLRLFGIPEAEIAVTLREASAAGIELSALEITTCLRRSEIEVAVRFPPAAEDSYRQLLEFIRERHPRELFSEDGATIDQQIASTLLERGLTVAVAESCTGGLMAGRLTELAGSSAYMLGGVVVYSNEAKSGLVGVPAELIESVGAVSVEVARALADGARERFGASLGVGITGVAGPGGGSEEKPVGFVCFSVCSDSGSLTRSARLPGSRSDVRDRSTTVALHLLARLLRGDSD